MHRRTPIRSSAVIRPTHLVLAVLAGLATLAGCGDSSESGDPADGGEHATAPEVVAGEPFPAERCEANREAGTITFLTGFDFAAASSIVEVINADALGYYEALCLDVEIRPSFSTANYQLVAGGQGQFASGGSFSEVVAFAAASDADLVAVTIAGLSPIDTLIVKPGVASSPADLAGTTIGVKGKLPTATEVMLATAGLDEGTDFETVLLDGFDPVAHMAIDAIDTFPGWVSNEPGQLQRAGIEFDSFPAAEAGVPGTFGAIFTTRQFVAEHPLAAQDFVRATLRGLAAAIDDPPAAAGAAVALVESGGNPNFLSPEGETFRWATEAEIVAEGATAAGSVPGVPVPDVLRAEVGAYAEVGLFGDGAAPSIDDYLAPEVTDAILADATSGGREVAWPG